jgi:hypothetical protein
MDKRFENLTLEQMEAASDFLSDLQPKFIEARNIAFLQQDSAENKVRDAVREGRYDAEFLQASSLLVHSSDTYHKLCMLDDCIQTVTDAAVISGASDVNHGSHKWCKGTYMRDMNYLVSVLADLGSNGRANRLIGIIDSAK